MMPGDMVYNKHSSKPCELSSSFLPSSPLVLRPPQHNIVRAFVMYIFTTVGVEERRFYVLLTASAEA